MFIDLDIGVKVNIISREFIVKNKLKAILYILPSLKGIILI